MKLVFGVHDHQPVGNFDHVIAEIYARSYLPFLETVERHEHFRFCLHVTGPLLEWLQRHEPGWLERAAFLVRSGRVEMLGGGFYEPILAAIPESDRVGQVRMMTDWLHRHLGAECRGVWMAERVWEPHLAGSLSRAGVDFALLDDYHFVQAGLSQEVLERGPVLTDDLGHEVALLPISEKLRYLIPFREPEETIAACREVHERDPEGVLVMVDDGEKFGAWPGTHELVFDRGWLDRFCRAVADESGWLELVHPSEALASRPASARAYLPPSSYFEMSEWALPMPAAETYADAVHAYRDGGTWEAMRPFFRGGFWRQFAQKYEESLIMQRRALLLHEEISTAEATGADQDRIDEARDHLWRAQCNCAYWHGVFGGLYLPHLRHAVYRHLILGTQIVQTVAPTPRAQMVTLCGRAGTDVRLGNERLELFLSPDRGGALVGLEDRREDWNLLNTLRRRREAYHTRIERAPLASDAAGPAPEGDGDDVRRTTAGGDDGKSIHDLVFTVTPEIRRALVVDPQPRYSLLERFLHPDADPDGAADDMAGADGGDFAAAPTLRVAPVFGPTGSLEDDRFVVKRTGRYRDRSGTEFPLQVEKAVTLRRSAAAFDVAWTLRNTGAARVRCRFAPEWNLALYDGGAYAQDGDGRTPLDAVRLDARRELAVLVPLHRAALRWELGNGAEVWIRAVRTATQGEDGFHLTYQGHRFLFVWNLDLDPGVGQAFRQSFTLEHGIAEPRGT